MHRSSLDICVVGLLVLLSIIDVSCHPQCLDSRPPFQAEKQLTFCPDYTDFGCCTSHDDFKLKNRYRQLQAVISANNTGLWASCANYVKTFLCETCSPYAAHVFDSEVNQNEAKVEPRTFPGLCKGYCTQFFNTCKDIVKYYMQDAALAERTKLEAGVTEGANSFCGHVGLSDVDYCYPELLTNPILTGKITLEQVTKPGCLCVETFQENQFRNPIFLKHANDGSNRMFVGEQIGLVHIMYPNGTRLPDPFIDIQYDIHTTTYKGDERGMLGMAFHPKYTENGKFYIYYSTPLTEAEAQQGYGDHKIRIEEFKVNSSSPNEVDYTYSRIILEVYEPFWNHNGGEILFAEDNYMYLFIGDGGKAGDPLQSGQDLNSLLGKVLRIDVDNVDQASRTEYSIPPDNPFADGVLARPEIYAYGVRNIWRCGMDRGDRLTGYGRGRIVCGDVGQSAVEELDLLEKGANYGWNLKEGSEPYCSVCHRALPEVNLTDPIFDYRHSVGKSVTGGNFYRGCESPNLNGFYIYGDFMSGRLFRLLEDPKTKKWTNKELNMCGPEMCTPPLSNTYTTSIISFGEDQAGEVYMLSTSLASTSKFQGSVYKIVDPARRGNPSLCKDKSSTGSTNRPTSAPTRPPTTKPETQPPATQPQSSPRSTFPPYQSSGTTRDYTSASQGLIINGPRLEYLDYFKTFYMRNKRRRIQNKLKEEKKKKPELKIHGIKVRKCTSSSNFWCSLGRFK